MAEPDVLTDVFALQIDDVTAGFFLGCSGIHAEYETYPYGEGGLNTFVHQLPGRQRYGNITLTRGVTSDRKLLEWFLKRKERAVPRLDHDQPAGPRPLDRADVGFRRRLGGPVLRARR